MDTQTPKDAAGLRQRAEANYQKKIAQLPEQSDLPLSPERARIILHELRVHQIELEMQNEELRLSQAALDASRVRYFDLYDLAPMGCCTVSAQGLTLEANLTLASLLGVGRGVLLKKPLSRFIHREDVASYHLLIRQLISSEAAQAHELRMVGADGTSFWAHLELTLARDEGGAPVCRIALSDTTARKEAMAALRVKEQEFRSLAESMPQIVWACRPDGGNIYFNQQWVDYTGLTLEESYGAGWNKPFHPDDRQRAWDAWQNATQNDATYALECRLRRADGAYRWWLIRGVPQRNAHGEILKWFGTCTDIEDIKQAAEVLRETLQQKEALLHEVHHRVKNNLQVISSLLSLEVRRNLEPGTKAVLQEMKGRIRSMALLHETLYRTKNFARVDLAGYLREVAVKLFRAQNADSSAVRLVLELAAAEVELDQAMPCGLLINELLTNTLKHAFPDGRHGEVRLGLQQTADGRVHLQVSDDGVGLPADLDRKNAQTLGLQLVTDLTKQLQGTLEIGPGPGASFSIVFTPKAATGTASPLQPAGPGTTGAATPSPG